MIRTSNFLESSGVFLENEIKSKYCFLKMREGRKGVEKSTPYLDV